MKQGIFGEWLKEHVPLIVILIGALLVSVSIGPFNNADTQLEYEATLAVIRQGMPYITQVGTLINQPPLGFYVAALVFKGFGTSFDTGVALVTLFGLGCTALVYAIGKALYDKSTGVVAAVLFAITPWQVVIQRSYLIDVQCLFFSLLTLLVGVNAIRKDSFKLFMASGTFFALALLTKLYAVYILIPLVLFYFYFRQEKLSRKHVGLTYLLPAIIVNLVWYGLIARKGLYTLFGHSDFGISNVVVDNPSFWFVGVFLLVSLGLLFLPTTVLSVVAGFFGRKSFPKAFSFDLMCLVTIVVVGSVNTFLGFGLNLNSPYISPAKYDYQFLPYFALLTASLVSKYRCFKNSVTQKERQNPLRSYVTIGGLVLLVGSIVLNMFFVHLFSTINYVVFSVELNKDLGYSFFNSAPIVEGAPLVYVQVLGFAFVIAGLILAIMNKTK